MKFISNDFGPAQLAEAIDDLDYETLLDLRAAVDARIEHLDIEGTLIVLAEQTGF